MVLININSLQSDEISYDNRIFKPAIRGFSFSLNEPYIPYIWYQVNWTEYHKLHLKPGLKLDIQLGNRICQMCMNDGYIFKNKCIKCIDKFDPNITMLSCMYNDELSLKRQGCSLTEFPCKSQSNVLKCFSEHVVYLGRFKNQFKIGISRANRTDGYLMRLIEQGLNEAFVLSQIPSLHVAQEIEEWFKNLGYIDRMSIKTKISQLRSKTVISLSDFLNENMFDNQFPEYKIEMLKLHADRTLPSKFTYSGVNTLRGKILTSQGPILLLEDEGEYFVYNLKDLTHRELIHDNNI